MEPTTAPRNGNIDALTICRDRANPRRVRISGTNAPRIIFAYDTPSLAQGGAGPNRAGPRRNSPSKGRAKPLEARFGAFVGSQVRLLRCDESQDIPCLPT